MSVEAQANPSRIKLLRHRRCHHLSVDRCETPYTIGTLSADS
jgi:hypothetical protein